MTTIGREIGREIIDGERDEFHETVEPKDAATLIIVDRSEAESKVLLGRRHKRHVFLPGKFVFPGGRVDPADRTMPVAKPLHAETERKLLVGSRLHAGHEARALALAAIRETFEETGIVVGAKAQVAGSWGAYLLFVRFTRARGEAERRGESGPSCWSGHRRFLFANWPRNRQSNPEEKLSGQLDSAPTHIRNANLKDVVRLRDCGCLNLHQAAEM